MGRGTGRRLVEGKRRDLRIFPSTTAFSGGPPPHASRREELMSATGQLPIRIATGDGADSDRKSVVAGKSGAVRVDLGGRRIIKKKKNNPTKSHNNYKL